MRFIDSSALLQSLVAVIAIAALVFLYVSLIETPTTLNSGVCSYSIIMHHRQEGQVLTHPEEEAALIGGLALLWIGKSNS